MEKYRRSVNKNLLKSLIYYNGYTFEKIGKLCNPPVSKTAISLLINEKIENERLIIQISELFHVPHLILFPFVQVQDSQPENQRKTINVEDP